MTRDGWISPPRCSCAGVMRQTLSSKMDIFGGCPMLMILQGIFVNSNNSLFMGLVLDRLDRSCWCVVHAKFVGSMWTFCLILVDILVSFELYCTGGNHVCEAVKRR
ncbi:unnamed protein product [Enterobius vermicularis]|uniref:7TM_GPCR_Srx domain-containing protein n=1 Tax=Enterobius vermicularis TaxID=51028 RepID=A0A0N4VDS6_ENTVE|nr:unnamed protein product [Enterobius vermicularis]